MIDKDHKKIKLSIFKIVNSVTGLIPDEHKILKKISRIYDIALFLVILSSLSSLSFSYKTVSDHKIVFLVIEIVAVSFLIIDLFLRFYVSEIKYSKIKNNKIAFWFMPEPIIIMLCILTSIGTMSYYYSGNFYSVMNDLKVLRILRLFLLFIYTEAFVVLYGAVKRAYKPLAMTLIFIFFTVIASSIIFYRLELQSTSKDVTHVRSYWQALYTVIITMATIGYGDFTPTFYGSRIFIAALAILGMFSIAIPGAILASSFIVEFRQEDKSYSLRNKVIRKMHSYNHGNQKPGTEAWKK